MKRGLGRRADERIQRILSKTVKLSVNVKGKQIDRQRAEAVGGWKSLKRSGNTGGGVPW